MKQCNTSFEALEALYNSSGNQLAVVYGRADGKLRDNLKQFLADKKYFYYQAREISSKEQCHMMGMELEEAYDIRVQNHNYEEYLKRVKSGDSSKLVFVVDEAQYILKKDPDFLEALLKLKAKKLYPGPVLILLMSSSLVWGNKELEICFGESYKKIDLILKVSELNFLDVVGQFDDASIPDIIRMYGVLGGVYEHLNYWNIKESFKYNICNLVLAKNGPLYSKAQDIISSELREYSVYNTILNAMANGASKLNDLYEKTGYSRAKISVYMKNLSAFDIIEKVQSFETGGWENAKKGVYQIKDTFIHFWYRFVFPHLSDLYLLSESDFYDKYIADAIDHYLSRYFQLVCKEYLSILNQMNRLPFAVTKIGTWVGKTGNIDIIAQSTDRQNIIGLCNWESPMLTTDMLKSLLMAMKKAKITSEHFYLFSAKSFEPALIEMARVDKRIELIDMNEL